MRITNNNPMNNTRALLAAGLVALLAGGTLAAAPEGTDRPGRQPVNLGGPRVDDAGRPDRGPAGADEQGRPQGPRLLEYMAAIRALRSSPDESLLISAEQREAITTILREHRAAMAEFMEAHKDEIKELREQAGLPAPERRRGGLRAQPGRERGPAGRPGGDRPRPENEMDAPPEDGAGPRSDDDGTIGNDGPKDRPHDGKNAPRPQPPTPEQQDARDRLLELMSEAPDDAEAVIAIEALLSERQIGAVHQAIADAQERRAEQGERPGDRMRARREGGPDETRRGQRRQGRPGAKPEDTDD